MSDIIIKSCCQLLNTKIGYLMLWKEPLSEFVEYYSFFRLFRCSFDELLRLVNRLLLHTTFSFFEKIMKFVNFQDFQYLKLDPVLPEFEEKVARF